MEKEEKMITKLTAVTEFWTYHYITIIDNNEIVTIAINNSELYKIQKRSDRLNLLRQRASLWQRLVMAYRIIRGK